MNYLVEPIIATAGTCTCNCLVFVGSHDTGCDKEICASKSSGSCSMKQICVSPTGIKISPE